MAKSQSWVRYNFVIKSTIDIADESDNIKAGETIYNTDEAEIYDTFDEAMDAGHQVLLGLDGGRAFNKALETAEITVEKSKWEEITPGENN